MEHDRIVRRMRSSARMKSYAVIGAGISGLSVARMLVEHGRKVVVYERDAAPGGLVRCERVDGVLYHCVGGHVFNSRNLKVLDWFWKQFRKDDFELATRHAVVSLSEGTLVDYPIENHLYQLPAEMREAVLSDLLKIVAAGYPVDSNFDDFLRHRFGETLYREYFAPYNRKIWRRSLLDVPLSWLRGKLPMPTVKEILSANIAQKKEMEMVHSTFLYPHCNGSQHIADTLAKDLDIRYNSPVTDIRQVAEKWEVNGDIVDAVVYCGNVRELPATLSHLENEIKEVEQLEYHGTTSVLCEVAPNPYSWIYMPSEQHESHRIICTGNFAASNSPEGMSTATIEFSEKMTRQEIEVQLAYIPFSPRYITHRYTPCTYPIQNAQTRDIISNVKAIMEPKNFYLLGRFAEWEYYNMDAAIEAAMNLAARLGVRV